jgi:hypothetical protein
MIGRRQLIAGLASAAAWPVVAWAQQGDRVRRIGVLLPATADDAVFQARVGAFLQGLALLGWTIGRNVRIDIRWATLNAAEIRRHAEELAALAPDVILANGASAVGPLLQVTRPCRSRSRSSPIQSPPGSLTAWRGRAATLPDSCRSNTAKAANGWSCSSRSRRA